MALYDTADLLASFIRHGRLPATREAPTDADICAYLTEAQMYWYEQLAVHVPQVLWSPLARLTSADGGVTYALPGETMGTLLLRESPRGEIILPAMEVGGDGYVLDGQTIRWPDGQTRTFADGPYARCVELPGVVDGDNEPTLPTRLRPLILYRALALWAREPTSGADPNVFLDLESERWSGRPDDASDVGVLGALKNEYQAGLGHGQHGGRWWRSPDLGG
jgi:hypothetical protein